MSIQSGEFDREEYKKQLRELAEKDKDIIVMLAARCALRVFPLLTHSSNLDFWRVAVKRSGKDPLKEGDQRAYHLSKVWVSCLKIWLIAAGKYEADLKEYVQNEIRTARSYIETATEMVGVNDTTYLDVIEDNPKPRRVVEWAMYVIAGSAYFASLKDSVSEQALRKMLDIIEVFAHLSVKTVREDFEHERTAKRKSDWLHFPLWHSQKVPSQFVDVVNVNFPETLDKLASNESAIGSESLSKFIKYIVPYYQFIANGEVDVNDLKKDFRLFDGKVSDSQHSKSSKQEEQLIYRASARNQSELSHGEDALDRTTLAQALVTIIRAPENKDHLTVGLIGDWGAGKSFLLNLVKEQLQHQPSGQEKETVDFLVGEFNAWAYEHSDNTHAGVAQEAIAALTQPVLREPLPEKFMSWARFKHWLAGGWIKTRLAVSFVIHHHLLRLITWVVLIALAFYVLYWVFADEEREIKHIEYLFGTVSLFAIVKGYLMLKGALLSPLAKVFRTYLKLPTYGEHLGQVPVMREHLRLLCDLRLKTKTVKGSKHQTRLLYIIDDLDRCGPEGIVKTFEAVRLMMDIPQVTVMIAVDHRIALAALAHHYDAMAKYQAGRPEVVIARDYLAKVIHLPIALGQSDSAVVDRYLSALLGQQDTAVAPDKESLPTAASNEADGTDRETGNPVRGEAPSDPAEQEGLQRDGPIEDNDGSTAPKPPAPLEALGMSPEHSQGLRYWVRQFGLHNPRQLKRLFNSYNLMRHYYGEEEEPVAVAGVEGDKEENVSELAQYAFPRMVGLLLLEWLNEQSVEIRKPLLDAIQKGAGPEWPKTTQTPDAVYNAIAVLSQSAAGYHQVAPFVLPALDPEMERQS